ncbi:MAG: AzlD domain-containing protein [Chloroflexota bacterium]|nr:AzlD domain-containing protein [Chloroflexota bacterium]
MKIMLIIVGMTAATYVPRMLPVFFMDRFSFPGWFKKWLQSIPYAALGALIFPGILWVEKDKPLIGIIGGLVAAVLTIFDLHIVIIMAAAIIATIVSQNLL